MLTDPHVTIQHGSCPTCRHIFLEIRPPSDSDGESSDGDYFPNEEEDEEEDDFIIESDADVDFDFEVDEMDLGLEIGEIWEDSGMDDGESWADEETTYSEADMSLTGELDALAEDGKIFTQNIISLRVLIVITQQMTRFAVSTKAPTSSNSGAPSFVSLKCAIT